MDLIINKSYIDGNKLISKIEYDDKSYDMFFQVDKEYKKFLCDSNSNAFLIALLPFIVKHNYNVVIKDKISSKLYYQLTTYLLPMLCKAFKKRPITISCELTDEHFNGTANGASISCGVDSFYTLLKHRNLEDVSKGITHLCFFNAGSNGEYGGDEARRLYNERVSHIKEFCVENNYPLITVDSNMNELILMNHEKRHTFTTLSCVYALEKLFGNYYFASGLEFDGSHIDESDTAFYDILNVQCLSNENITFYCSGLESSRMDKIKYISNYKETYNWLNVCIRHDWTNCGHCSKCIRTMTELDSIGMLNKYSKVFDLDDFYKNRVSILSEILFWKKEPIKCIFADEILDNYKKSGIKIPFKSRVKVFFSIKRKIKIYLKRLPFIQRMIKNKKIKKDGWTD